MKGILYLYVSKDDGRNTYGGSTAKLVGRVADRKEIPKHNEVEFKLAMDIPDELFQKPTYEAQISLTKTTTSTKTPKVELKADAVEVWLEHNTTEKD